DIKESKLYEQMSADFLVPLLDPSKNQAQRLLQVNCAPGSIASLLSKLPDAALWSATLSKGKISIVTDNLDDSLARLLKWTTVVEQRLTVNFADNDYNQRVCQLPTDDIANVQLKNRLKDKFDPLAIFNSFVRP